MRTCLCVLMRMLNVHVYLCTWVITRPAILSECVTVTLECFNIRRRLRKIGVNWSIPPKRVVRKAVFSTRIRSRRYGYEHPVHAATVTTTYTQYCNIN